MVMVKLPECDVGKVTELIESYIPSAQLESNVSAELSYILPADQVRHGNFQRIREIPPNFFLCCTNLNSHSYRSHSQLSAEL